MSSARNQVLYSLNDYLSNLELAELSNQAYVGGISFSSYANDGLTIKASGYTQRLVPLVNALLDRYLALSPTAQQLQQAKTWFRQQLDGTDKGKYYSQAIIPAKVLSDIPYIERDARRALIDGIMVLWYYGIMVLCCRHLITHKSSLVNFSLSATTFEQKR